MKESTNFRSLNRLSDSINYVQTTLARISGLLLLLGLVTATANLLDDDVIFHTWPALQNIWGVIQALAVDSGLALIFMRLFSSIRQQEKTQIVAYSIIGGLLFLVATAITAIESVRQAFGTTLVAAAGLMHIPLLLLTPIRAIVAVALVAVSNIDIMTAQPPDPTPTPIKEGLRPETLEGPGAVVKPVKAKASRQLNGNGRGEVGIKGLEYLTINPTADDLTVMAATMASRSTVRNYKKKLAGASPWKGLAGKEEEATV